MFVVVIKSILRCVVVNCCYSLFRVSELDPVPGLNSRKKGTRLDCLLNSSRRSGSDPWTGCLLKLGFPITILLTL